jgi:uncharacterized protein
MPSQLLCPTCHRQIQWSEQFPHRPFCSDRCRLIDLGAWLTGEQAIPGESVDPERLTEIGAPNPDGRR